MVVGAKEESSWFLSRLGIDNKGAKRLFCDTSGIERVDRFALLVSLVSYVFVLLSVAVLL